MEWSWLVFVSVLRSQAVVPLTDWCLNKNDFMYRMAMSKQRAVKKGERKLPWSKQYISAQACLLLRFISIRPATLIILLCHFDFSLCCFVFDYRQAWCWLSIKQLTVFVFKLHFQLLSSVCPKRSSVKVFRDPEIYVVENFRNLSLKYSIRFGRRRRRKYLMNSWSERSGKRIWKLLARLVAHYAERHRLSEVMLNIFKNIFASPIKINCAHWNEIIVYKDVVEPFASARVANNWIVMEWMLLE